MMDKDHITKALIKKLRASKRRLHNSKIMVRSRGSNMTTIRTLKVSLTLGRIKNTISSNSNSRINKTIRTIIIRETLTKVMDTKEEKAMEADLKEEGEEEGKWTVIIQEAEGDIQMIEAPTLTLHLNVILISYPIVDSDNRSM